MVINVPAIENALYDFIFAASGSKETVWAFQNMPQQEDPRVDDYCELSISSLARVGVDYQGPPDPAPVAPNIPDNKITGNREFTLTVNVRGSNAMSIAEDIRTALQKNSVLETLRGSGLVYVTDEPIQNLTGLEATQFIQRFLLDIRFRLATEPTAAAGAIEHVEADAEYYKDGTLVLEQEITIN